MTIQLEMKVDEREKITINRIEKIYVINDNTNHLKLGKKKDIN